MFPMKRHIQIDEESRLEDHDLALFIADAGRLTACLFESEQDIYIVDRNFDWTFVKTHESYCGPYFCSKS